MLSNWFFYFLCWQEKKFACDLCSKGFYTNSELVMHRRSHTGEKPFKCTLCGRSFAQVSRVNKEEEKLMLMLLTSRNLYHILWLLKNSWLR